MSQTIRPDADVQVATWQSSIAPYNSGLYSRIDETSVNANEYVWGTPDSGVYICSLSNPAQTPEATGTHTIRVNARKYSNQSTMQLKVSLYQTNTLISEETFTLTTSDAFYNFDLTSGEVATISDYNALRLRFDLTGSDSTRAAQVSWAEVELPDSGTSETGLTANLTLSAVAPTVGVGFVIDGVVANLTLSAVAPTVSIPVPLSTDRDIFTVYNAASDRFHVGQIKTTHNPEAGVGTASYVEFQHFVYGFPDKSLHRFKYDDTYASAFLRTGSLATAEVGGAYYDRPDSVIVGFWSYGAWPDFDNPNTSILYEASLPRDLRTVPNTNGYPYYGASQPDEDVYFIVPATDFGEPLVQKRLSRIYFWIVPPEGTSNQVTITVTVRPQPVNAMANTPTYVSRTVTPVGYVTTSDQPGVPVKLVYVDFDPTPGAVSGEQFEIKVQLGTGIGVYRFALEVEMGGRIFLVDYQP